MRRGKSDRLVTLRLQPWQHELLKRAAQAHGKRLNRWCVDGLSQGYQLSDEPASGLKLATNGAPRTLGPAQEVFDTEQMMAFVS